jgi:phage baseplate assembly protein W
MAITSVADRFTLRRVDNTLYRDFLTNLNPHPDSKQLVTNDNEDAVVRSIKNLILTDKFERPFQPNIGCRIKSFLFENISPQVTTAIRTEIETTINDHEPRAKLLEVIVAPIEERNMYVITIVFYTINIEEPITFKVVLERVR